MARKTSPTISPDELYPPSQGGASAEADDVRMFDLDGEQESPFLRGQKRISARRGPLPKKTAKRLKWVLLFLTGLGGLVFTASYLYSYGQHSWRLRLASSDDLEITGIHNVARAQVLEVMGGDIGRNVFFVPLSQRQRELEQIPWVESASVMRFLPNRLRVEIQERTPVAFARIGSRIALVDAAGIIMDLPPKRKYSFPVILGMGPAEPLSTRAARMKIYNQLIGELDSGGAHYSQDLSEVDLSDPEDVKVLANNSGGAVLVDLGASNFSERYKIYITHLSEWRRQFEKLDSVDLRYDGQIIVNPDLGRATKPAPLASAALRAALAAGVKPAALLAHEPNPQSKLVRPIPLRPLRKQAAVKRNPRQRANKKRAAGKVSHTVVGKPPAPRSNLSKHAASPAVSSSEKPASDPSQTTKKPSPAITKEQANP